jgi:hypothetical protein
MPVRAASVEAFGVYFADAGQHLEHRLFVDHEAPHCRSHVEYKGALQGDTAHTVWVGDVLIRAGAEGTETYELNRNLVLTDGARADSVPNLEIETGQIVGAGHASATGRFDDEQLFYLQARGIPEDEARRLVVRGFFADIINRIPVAETPGPPHAGRRARARRSRRPIRLSNPPTTDACTTQGPTPMTAQLDTTSSWSATWRTSVGTPALADVDGIPMAWCAPPRPRCTPSTTSAPTPTSRCPRASSTAARWSAGCTARVSTCAPATPSGPPATVPVAVYPVRLIDGAVHVSTTPSPTEES